jgi:hypothetical protein
VTTAMVNVDLYIRHATRALSVVSARMSHFPESMVVSEAGQADKGYFVINLTLAIVLQQSPMCNGMTD